MRMALFGKKTKTEEKEGKREDLSWVLISPLVSEKAVILSGKRAYVFKVSPRANRIQIKKAIEEKYGVHPTKVNVLVKKARDFLKRGRKVHKAKEKKAIVFLKEGESIEIFS